MIDRLGVYRVLGELGRGGMGVVYLGERADGQFEQTVALKILEISAGEGRSSASRATARFERERQILASLEHPGIARILDGGIAPDGRPWFAMERVEGKRIDQFCAENQLDTRARLGLFVQVARAVAAAHRQLVVHRDIKPENILVTAQGVAKLLDFGIAKLVEDDAALTASELTRAAAPMTPRYASPEQASGRPVTTASDVYQLGRLLQELLSSASKAELRGDLETIVSTALRPQPERRYESASHLADDVERSLGGLPIRARADSAVYRARKFLARHRWAAVASTAALGTVAGLWIFYGWRLRDERDAARREAAKARSVSLFLADLFKASDPFSAKQVAGRTALELLDEGAATIEQGSALAEQPEVRAALLDVVGTVYGELNKMEPALRHNQAALELRTRLLGPSHVDTLETRLHRATLERLAGNYETAQRLGRELIPQLEATLGPRDWRVGEAKKQLARASVDAGSLEEAQAAIAAAIAIEEAQRPPNPRRLAQMFVVQSGVSGRRGELERAVAEGWRAVELLREADATDTTIANALSGLAGNLQNLGRLDEARKALSDAERMVVASAGPEHPLALRISLRIASLSILLEEYEDGIRRLDTAIPAAERVLGPVNSWLGMARMSRAMALADTGRLDEAVAEATRGRDVMAAAFGTDAQIALDSNRRLAGILQDAGRLGEARDLFRQTIARAEAQSQPSAIVLSGCHHALADVLRKLGDGAAAEEAIERSLALRWTLWPQGHIDLVRTLASQAEIRASRKDLAGARQALARASELAARVEGMTPALRERLERLDRELPKP